jgi:hypothetical protein
MATAKKATSKKPAAKKAAPRKVAAKKTTARKKPAAKKTTFTNEDSFKTFVWFILAFAIFALSLWVLNVHLDLYKLTTELGM